MSDTQRPQRPTARPVPVRPGFEPETDMGAEDLPSAGTRPAPKKKPSAKKAPARKKTPAKKPAAKAAPRRPAARKPAARSTTARRRSPATARPRVSRTDVDGPDIDFTYTDDAERRPTPPAATRSSVGADGAVHLAFDDEPWWMFPNVCVKTGEPTTATITHVASGAPKWSYLAFLLGVLPGYLIVRTAFPNATLKLPFAARIRNRRRVATTAALVLFLGGFGAMIGGGVAENDNVLGIGFLAFFLSLIAILIAARVGRVKVRMVNREVIVPNVHPAFAAAFAEQPTPDEQRMCSRTRRGPGTLRSSRGR